MAHGHSSNAVLAICMLLFVALGKCNTCSDGNCDDVSLVQKMLKLEEDSKADKKTTRTDKTHLNISQPTQIWGAQHWEHCGAPHQMPAKREFGFKQKNPDTSALYKAVDVGNGQYGIVVEQGLLRGVTPEMILWWFRRMGAMKVAFNNVPDYSPEEPVPAYWLWHPFDHICFFINSGGTEDGSCQVGTTFSIIETFGYDKTGWKFYTDSPVIYEDLDLNGWMMSGTVDGVGTVLAGRVALTPTDEGTAYHYEFALGVPEKPPNLHLKKAANAVVKLQMDSGFWDAWFLHCIQEVSAFENFLPAIWKQRKKEKKGIPVTFDPTTDNCASEFEPFDQKPYDPELFETRVQGMQNSDDVTEYVRQGPFSN